jgi:hypothetical protein
MRKSGISTRWQAVAMAMVLTTGAAGGAGAQEANQGAAAVYHADVVVDEAVVDERGAMVDTRPQTRYRISVRRVGQGLETEIVYPPARLFAKGPLTDPRGGYRYVFDDGFANPRLYDPSGALISRGEAQPGDEMPSVAAPRAYTLADSDRRARHDDLVQRFGPAVGTVSGRDRYVAQDGDETTELLVEPSTMLPVEINVVRLGALAQRTGLAYGRLPGRRWYVATMRSELPLPGPAGRRFVSTSTYLNVVAPEVQ